MVYEKIHGGEKELSKNKIKQKRQEDQPGLQKAGEIENPAHKL